VTQGVPGSRFAVGTIVLWSSDDIPESSGWTKCDGSATASSDLSKVLENYPGLGDGQVPDLRGCFVRGVDPRHWIPNGKPYMGDPDTAIRTESRDSPNLFAGVGSFQQYQLESHSHGYQHLPDKWDNADRVGLSLLFHYNVADQQVPTGNAGGNETRPANVYLYHLIKNTDVGDDVPLVGTIAMWVTAKAPPGWLLCDGTTYHHDDYEHLADVLGKQFKIPNTKDFYVPDLRGLFVRGVDDSDPQRDPDRATRLDPRTLNDKAPLILGAKSGSVQYPSLAPHAHSISCATAGGDGYRGVLLGDPGWVLESASTQATGGNESRPANVALNFIINAGVLAGKDEGASR